MNALIVITLIINKLSNNYKIMDKTEIMGLNLLNNDCLIEKNELYAKNTNYSPLINTGKNLAFKETNFANKQKNKVISSNTLLNTILEVKNKINDEEDIKKIGCIMVKY